MPMILNMADGRLAPNLSRRAAELVRDASDLSPAVARIRLALWEGNEARALAGTDAAGRPFPRLAPATMKRRGRRGLTGPPLAPRGSQSREVALFIVAVVTGPGRASFTGSWPGAPWMGYHRSGTAHMPPRDPFGWTDATLGRVRGLLLGHILGDAP